MPCGVALLQKQAPPVDNNSWREVLYQMAALHETFSVGTTSDVSHLCFSYLLSPVFIVTAPGSRNNAAAAAAAAKPAAAA